MLAESSGEIEIVENLKQLEKVEPNRIADYINQSMPKIVNFGIQVLLVVIVYIIGVRIIKFARKLARRSLERAGAEKGLRQFADSLLKAVLYFLLFVLIGSMFGLTASSVAALLGSVGVTIGLALQGSLSNFAGGVLILLLKPFKVGDYIREEPAGCEGTVAEIQLFYTKLKTVDNKVVIIPNGTLANSNITNYSDQTKRMVDIRVGIAYDADLKKAKELVMALLREEEKGLKGEPIQVFVDSLQDSAVSLGARIWVATEDYWEVRWRLTEEIKLLFDKHQIVIPFQQVDVHIRGAEGNEIKS